MRLHGGLTTAEAQARLAQHGPNRLPEPKRKSAVMQLLGQLASPLVLTLLAAAAVATVVAVGSGGEAGFLTRYGDAIAILLIVALNALLGSYQERKAESAVAALRRLEVPLARVRRDGQTRRLPAVELVPGDILELEAGDAVPADARLVEATRLAIEEAALTGESVPVHKGAADPVFLGTTAVAGRAVAAVIATGSATELGRIGRLLEGAGDRETPLEARLRRFGHKILRACLAVSAALFGYGLLRGGRPWPQLLLEAVSFAVAAIPEGLPAITTITLALGMQRMARRGAIVRRLPAVETLGAATVICADKTGTLTQNRMTVRELVTLDGSAAVERALLTTAAVCNDARLGGDGSSLGDPTEVALLVAAAEAGLRRESLEVRVESELPFDADRKRMTVVARVGGRAPTAYVKGSADLLLPRCTHVATAAGVALLGDGERARLRAQAEEMARRALRVLAFAERERPAGDPEEGLTWLGLIGMIDPPRAGVKEAIAACHQAGVRAVMITGDHPLTAAAIARELDLADDDDETMSGAELAALDERALQARIGRVRVFARTTPEQKLQLVRAFKAAGEVVAMTGDGVNDAPALREAHIGVAMGRGGTDVARQAADMVVSDDNFATIVEAVREGRAIWRNIQKFIFFLLSANAGLGVAVFGIALAPSWLPLTPLMILWINLVTNGLPALALGVDPADREQMHEPPRAAGEELMRLRDYLGILYVGAVMGALALAMYATASSGAASPGARTMSFTLLALAPLFHAWSCRSPRASLATARPLVSLPLLVAMVVSGAIQLLAVEVPGLRPVFRTEDLHARDWLLVVGCAFAVVPAVELAKLVSRLRAARRARLQPRNTP
jgi:Ca2+-transporting ATPase